MNNLLNVSKLFTRIARQLHPMLDDSGASNRLMLWLGNDSNRLYADVDKAHMIVELLAVEQMPMSARTIKQSLGLVSVASTQDLIAMLLKLNLITRVPMDNAPNQATRYMIKGETK